MSRQTQVFSCAAFSHCCGAQVESYAALPVDVMQVEAQAATVPWSEWMLPLFVLVAVLALLHRSDRALFGSMAPVGAVTRRATTPAPNVIRQMRDDMTLTPPMATALGALVAMGAHIGIVALTLIGRPRRNGPGPRTWAAHLR